MRRKECASIFKTKRNFRLHALTSNEDYLRLEHFTPLFTDKLPKTPKSQSGISQNDLLIILFAELQMSDNEKSTFLQFLPSKRALVQSRQQAVLDGVLKLALNVLECKRRAADWLFIRGVAVYFEHADESDRCICCCIVRVAKETKRPFAWRGERCALFVKSYQKNRRKFAMPVWNTNTFYSKSSIAPFDPQSLKTPCLQIFITFLPSAPEKTNFFLLNAAYSHAAQQGPGFESQRLQNFCAL